MPDSRTGGANAGIEVTWCLPDGTRRHQTVADMDSLMVILRDPAGVTIDQISYQVSHSELIMKDGRLTATVHLKE